MKREGINEDIITILRVANLFEIYEEAIKNDLKQFRMKKRLRKSNPNESFTSSELYIIDENRSSP